MTRRIRVIGCGSPGAGDDAVGLLAVEMLRERVPAGVDVREAGPASKVPELLTDADTAILIDAVRGPPGVRQPGMVVRAEGPDLGPVLSGSLSSHGVGLAESVALAEAVGATAHVIFHGIEAEGMETGSPLSHAATAALPELVDAVMADIRAEVEQ